MGVAPAIIFCLLIADKPYDFVGQVRDVDLRDRVIVLNSSTGYCHYELDPRVTLYSNTYHTYLSMRVLKESDQVKVMRHHGVIQRILLLDETRVSPETNMKQNNSGN